MSETKYIARITIRDVKAIEFLQFQAGGINVLSGRNGVGKSSVLDAIAAPFDGGHDAGLIRQGAEKAEITLLLSDGTEIKKTITAKGSLLSVITADGALVRSPKSYVEDLAVSFAYDPLALIDAKPAERMAWLLEHMPIDFSGAELNKALGVAQFPESQRIPLEHLNQIAEGVRTKRTDANRRVRDHEGMIRRGHEAIGEDDQIDWKARLGELQNEESKLEQEVASATGTIDSQAERMRSECRQKAGQEIQAIKDRLAGELQSINEDAVRVLEEGLAERKARLGQLTGEIATASEKLAQQNRNAGARQNIELYRKQMSAANVESDALSGQLTRIERLKQTKLAEVAIPGLDLRDGGIWVDGIPWEHINQSQQDIVALQMGSYGLRNLPMYVIQRSEHIDEDRWANVLAGLKDANVQVFAERVTEGELMITSDDKSVMTTGKLFPDTGPEPVAAGGDPNDAVRRGSRRK